MLWQLQNRKLYNIDSVHGASDQVSGRVKQVWGPEFNAQHHTQIKK